MMVPTYVQKPWMDIPIPISYIFHEPSRIKKFLLTSQLMSSNFQLGWVPDFGCILELEPINCIFNFNNYKVRLIGL